MTVAPCRATGSSALAALPRCAVPPIRSKPPAMTTAPDPQYFASFDDTRLAWREVGSGRPVVLIHGYFSDA